jgi:RNA polymerase sigma-70 factor (ECF subfamily)
VRRSIHESFAACVLMNVTLDLATAGDMPISAPADHLLVAQAYARRATQLWSFARRLGLDPTIAEDVMQEAFSKALAAPHGAVGDLDAWLFRVVHNLAMDQHRRARRVQQTQPTTHPDQDALDARLALWAQVDVLPVRQRAVIYLRYRADLSFASVAQILGITEAGARANAARAIASLRQTVTR